MTLLLSDQKFWVQQFLQQRVFSPEFDLILTDYALPNFDGISALEIAHNLRFGLPFIFVSASLGKKLVIEALKQGATDYVLKQRLGWLVSCVQGALRET